jgi:hypothetical protein
LKEIYTYVPHSIKDSSYFYLRGLLEIISKKSNRQLAINSFNICLENSSYQLEKNLCHLWLAAYYITVKPENFPASLSHFSAIDTAFDNTSPYYDDYILYYAIYLKKTGNTEKLNLILNSQKISKYSTFLSIETGLLLNSTTHLLKIKQ